jgi:DNA replication protein DnaC
MARSFREQLADTPGSQLTFSERVALMVDREWTDRENRRLARLMHSARLSVSDAAMENISCDPARGIDKSVIRDLATCKWIRNKQNVVVVGKTGVGKCSGARGMVAGGRRRIRLRDGGKGRIAIITIV